MQIFDVGIKRNSFACCNQQLVVGITSLCFDDLGLILRVLGDLVVCYDSSEIVLMCNYFCLGNFLIFVKGLFPSDVYNSRSIRLLCDSL